MNVTKGKTISAKYSFSGQENGFKLNADCESREVDWQSLKTEL